MTEYSKPPVIGISGMAADSKSVMAMAAQVRANGGIPLIITNHAGRDPYKDIEKIDALFVMGNDWDIDPGKYVNRYPEGDPRRDVHKETNSALTNPAQAARAVYEEKILTLAMQRNLPTLGVCAGMQTINVLLGGGLLQHIPDLVGTEDHNQMKKGIQMYCPVIPIHITTQSALGAIADGTASLYAPSFPPPQVSNLTVNSYHHQAIDPDLLGRGLRIVASSDAYKKPHGETRYLPEAVEPDPTGPLKDWPMLGVQWHPEFGDSKVSAKVIATMVDRGAQHALCLTRDRSKDEEHAQDENLHSMKVTPLKFDYRDHHDLDYQAPALSLPGSSSLSPRPSAFK